MVIKCCGYEGFESGGKVTQAAGVSKQTLLKLIEVLRRSCLLGDCVVHWCYHVFQ